SRDHRAERRVDVVILGSVEVAGAGDHAGHHDVVAAAVVRVWVRQAAEDGQLVSDLGGPRQQVGELDAGDVGADRPEVAANLGRSVVFVSPQVVLRPAAEDEDEDAVDIAFLLRRCRSRLEPEKLRQAQPRQAADAQKLPTMDAVTEIWPHAATPLRDSTHCVYVSVETSSHSWSE